MDEQEISAHDVARELRKRVPGLDSFQMHKLLYYVQGWHLAIVGLPLFEEKIEAWEKGPVVSELWHNKNEGVPVPAEHDVSNAALNTIGYVVSRYGGLSGEDLIHLTHEEAPWQDAYSPGKNEEITHEALKQFFSDEHQSSSTYKIFENAMKDPKTAKFFNEAVAETLANPGEITDVEAFTARVLNGS